MASEVINKPKKSLMMEMKVEVISRETIKPSSRTPHHLRSFKLSLLDQFAPPIYTPLVLFYATTGGGGSGGGGDKKSDHKAAVAASEISQLLKKSLSETLTRFYPLAGRIKDHLSVDCNDDGVDYFEARVNCSISCILEQPKSELLNHFLPTEFTKPGGPLLLIQASFFECGGMALGLQTNHTVADAFSFGTFLKGWAAIASGFPDAVVPEFRATASMFPAKTDFPTLPSRVYEQPPRFGVTRRYMFGASKLNALKAKAASPRVQQPTRVEAVSALIWKCAVAASRSRLTSPRPSVLILPANLRARLVPPLSEWSFGNIACPLVLQADDERESEKMELPSLVCRIREGKLELSKNCAGRGPEICSWLMEMGKKQGRLSLRASEEEEEEVDLYTETSWCGMPWYEADFGWGKPTWATIGYVGVPNVVVLSDARDGEGIEAWVSLVEEDMALFHTNQDLLAFATLNPSAALN